MLPSRWTTWIETAVAAVLVAWMPLPGRGAMADGSRVFDEGRVARIRLTLAAADLARLTAAPATNSATEAPYLPALFEFDGTALAQVGVRLKGNSSRSVPPGIHPSLKIDFNRFRPGQEFDGLTKLNLHNGLPEASHLAEYLSYGAWRAFGVPAPRTGWTEVEVNGSPWGLYASVEDVDPRFLARHFAFVDGSLYQPEPPAGTLAWRGSDPTNYPGIGPELQPDSHHAALLHFLGILNHQPVSDWPDSVDLHSVLVYLAGNAALGNPDAYPTTGHNYFLYESAPGRFSMLPWDMNWSQSAPSPILPVSGGGGPFPLAERLVADPRYRPIYLRLLRDFLAGPASRRCLSSRIDQAVAVLAGRPNVAAVATLRANLARRVDLLNLNLALQDPPPPLPALRLNELMAANDSHTADPFGEFDDWIEIHNAGPAPVDLSGMFLSDDPRDPRRWRFPAPTVLAPDAHLLLWADGTPAQGPYHLNFRLERSGETLTLRDTDAQANLLIDRVAFGPQPPNVSLGRVPGSHQLWLPQLEATPGAANPALDSDHDGLPDVWETFHHFEPHLAADPDADSDGDGVANREEFRDETDPRDPASALRLRAIALSRGRVRLDWDEAPDRHYRIESASDPTQAAWELLDQPDTDAAWFGAVPASGNARFYRLRWIPE